MPIVHNIQGKFNWFEIPKNEIEKIDFALCDQPKETIEHYYNRQTNKPKLICNGGFFNMSDGTTIFNYRDNGLSISVSSAHTEGMGVRDNNILEFGFCEICKLKGEGEFENELNEKLFEFIFVSIVLLLLIFLILLVFRF